MAYHPGDDVTRSYHEEQRRYDEIRRAARPRVPWLELWLLVVAARPRVPRLRLWLIVVAIIAIVAAAAQVW